jgi:hypothetical protein
VFSFLGPRNRKIYLKNGAANAAGFGWRNGG